MACELPDDYAFGALLQARALLAHGATELFFTRGEHDWACSDTPPTNGTELLVAHRGAAPRSVQVDMRTSIHLQDRSGLPTFSHPDRRPVDAGMLALARVYLPVLLGAARAQAAGRSFVVGHVTQTLDGRIACHNGHSQWIGNAADRRHAHRMRALLDGVMVGAGTALADDPQLTVRLVEGPQPRRIVLSGSARVLRERRALRLFESPGCIVMVADDCDVEAQDNVMLVGIGADGPQLPPSRILAALRDCGVHSIYLEGGSGTLSSFLAAGCIDLLQVHIAPTILGSGVPSVQLPPVDRVDDGIRFVMDHAVLDGDVLLSCWPRPQQPG